LYLKQHFNTEEVIIDYKHANKTSFCFYKADCKSPKRIECFELAVPGAPPVIFAKTKTWGGGVYFCFLVLFFSNEKSEIYTDQFKSLLNILFDLDIWLCPSFKEGRAYCFAAVFWSVCQFTISCPSFSSQCIRVPSLSIISSEYFHAEDLQYRYNFD
jgi:hypothetical protein